MRGKPNSWLPLAERHVEKPCWKLTLCTKNSTFRQAATWLRVTNQQAAMISPASVFPLAK